ncbi:MAG: hypothetical protein Q8P19_02645 [bacterium]|nr:hypothetical protein [bacterium]
MNARKKPAKKKIDTVEKLAVLVADSIEDLRGDMHGRMDGIGDQISALQDRVSAVEGKIAGLHRRRIDQELDTRKQHAVRLASIARRLELPEVR